MKIKVFLFCILQVSLLTLSAQTTRTWGAWDKWGEQPDGTYLNPVIPADYSDLDCIRVGDDYYAISSTMQYSPGMTILHSRDLVNWEIAGNAVSDLSEISPALTWQQMDRYGRGIWAGTLRHHDGRFYLYFGTPDEGFFMTSATKAEGPWDPLTCLLAESGWDDCSVIWDEDGDAWFIDTCFREGYKTYFFRMASDGRSIHRSTARLVNEGYGREANKLIYHDGYYYLIFSEPDADATGTVAGGHATGTGAGPDSDATGTVAGGTRRAPEQDPTLTRRAPRQDSTLTRRALGFMRLGLLFGEKFPSVFNIDALLRVCLNCAALEVVSG
ncbi:MAG: family 43 glycosylhydrolase [Bacteroidaceae bacterium]|nr:family 43 glycosylhydrolase [Bacteroidaceae bacterium]